MRRASGRRSLSPSNRTTPGAAIRVACIWLHWLDTLRQLRYRSPHGLPGTAHFAKGQEVGWFQHGSTILVLAPRGFSLAGGIPYGTQIRMGQALMQPPPANPPAYG